MTAKRLFMYLAEKVFSYVLTLAGPIKIGLRYCMGLNSSQKMR